MSGEYRAVSVNLSSDVHTRLMAAKIEQDRYIPTDEIRAALATKAFIGVEGPAVIGKSTIMNAVHELDPHFQRVRGITSRERDARDEEDILEFASHTDDGLSKPLDTIGRRGYVQYIIHPTTERLYATRPEDYPGEINMKDVVPSSMKVFRQLGFKSLLEVGIVMDSWMWHQWFATRYPIVNDERTKRLQEGISNVTQQLDTPDMIWVENRPGDPSVAAQEIIDIQLKRREPKDNRTIAEKLLRAMKTMG